MLCKNLGTCTEKQITDNTSVFASQAAVSDKAGREATGIDIRMLESFLTIKSLLQMTLMTSWAVVCDVYFLEPQSQQQDESAQQFAERVQHLIAKKANLKVAPWDGYLKYYNLGKKVRQSYLTCCLSLSSIKRSILPSAI